METQTFITVDYPGLEERGGCDTWVTLIILRRRGENKFEKSHKIESEWPVGDKKVMEKLSDYVPGLLSGLDSRKPLKR